MGKTYRNAFGDFWVMFLVLKQIIKIPDIPAENRIRAVMFAFRSGESRNKRRSIVKTEQAQKKNEGDQSRGYLLGSVKLFAFLLHF